VDEMKGMSPMLNRFLVTLVAFVILLALAYDAYLCAAVIPEPWGFVVWFVQAFIGAWLWEFYGAKNRVTRTIKRLQSG
jgi:hypothetical protein